MDRQGDGSETVANQDQRLRVRVHRSVRGAGGVRERRGGPVRAERGDELRRRAAGGGCGAAPKCRVAGDGSAPSAAAAPEPAAEGRLWRDCVENPDAWWDNRSRKAEPGGNPRYPDFKHRESQTPWIESQTRPLGRRRLANGGAALRAGVCGAAAAAPAAAGGGEGFDPYYAGDAVPAGPGAGTAYEPDYSQPYAPEVGGYEPAKPFPEEDEPPF